MKVRTFESKWSYYFINFLDKISDRFAGFRHVFNNGESDPDTVTLRDMSFDSDTSRFFSAKQYVFIHHDTSNMFKADLGHSLFKSEMTAHFANLWCNRKRGHYFSTHTFFGMQVINEK